MCMEDVRINRQLSYETSRATVTVAAGVGKIVGARGRRVAVIITLNGQLADALNAVPIGPPVGDGTIRGLVALSTARPSVVLRVEEYGPTIEQELHLQNFIGLDIVVDVTELYWSTEPAEKK